MRLYSPLLLVSLLSLAVAQNYTNNGVGSTPCQRHSITALQASSVISAANASAATIIPQNIAIVDPSGSLVGFLRMDNAYPGSIDISMKKARTAVIFNGIPSAGLYNASQPEGALYGIEETNGGLVVFGGGLPIYDHGGFLIGGIGVSGGSVAQDVTVAMAGIAGLTACEP